MPETSTVVEPDPASLGPSLRRVIATWTDCFEKEHGTRPVLTKGKDVAILARLIREKGADEVCEIIKGYLETGTRWAREQMAWTIPAFAHQYNTLLAMKADDSRTAARGGAELPGGDPG